MPRFEQYEVWVQAEDERWEPVAMFADLELANAVAQSRPRRVRLLHTAYEDGRRVLEEVLAEIGSVRTRP